MIYPINKITFLGIFIYRITEKNLEDRIELRILFSGVVASNSSELPG
jgi:hypothetical protein